MMLTAALTAPLAAHAVDLRQLLAARGLRPVESPISARDFELPRLGGGSGSLSDFQGEWVLLTFWAAWCGPCRTEMPTLEQLHRTRQAAGLAVVGISVDRTRDAAATFVQGLDLSLPNFWDERGEVGTAYRATSIPLTYLIDPHGGIVAVSRGARDWTELGPMLDEILTARPTDPQAEATYGEGPVELTSISSPPTAEVSLADSRPRLGKPFHLDIALHWSGDFAEYLPHPPKVVLPDQVTEEGVTASTSSREGRNLVTYRVSLRAQAPGTYALDPIELRYTPRFESAALSSRIQGPTVEIRPRTIAGLQLHTLMLGGTGVALLALLGFAAARRLRAGRMPATDDLRPSYQRLRQRLDQAKALRLRGDAGGFVAGLAEIEAELGPASPGEEPDGRWHDRLEAARYGGQPPAAEEMDRLQRRIERRLEALRPDREEADRRSLRLKEEA